MLPKKKNHAPAAISLAVILAAFLLGLWPILVLVSPCLCIYAMCRTAVKTPAPAEAEPPLELPAPATEQSMIAIAFGVLQNRITEAVRFGYPSARWTWAVANAQECFAAGRPLIIMLNGSGGYRKALVQVYNLQFSGLVYQTTLAPSSDAPGPEGVKADEELDTKESADYGLLAFEWVEANAEQLNARSDEAVDAGLDSFRIPSSELPHGDSWTFICAELVRNGFTAASVLADGIHVQITTEKGA